MNCRNCGAAMELFAQRRYFFCAHCGTFEFIGAPAVEGLEVLGRPAEARACPLCGAPLAAALLDDAYQVQHCERCRGLLLTRGLFAEAVARRRARATGPPAPPVPADPRELQRSVGCPSCGGRMDVHPYYGPGNVVIDSCTACNLVWLDHGELKQIADAPGRDRGREESAAPGAAGLGDDARRERRTGLADLFDSDLLDLF